MESYGVGCALVLLMDLTPNAELGPGSIGRLEEAAVWAQQNHYQLCVAATFSPALTLQKLAMSTLAARWLDQHYPQLVVHDLTGEGEFNTRGEIKKCIKFAQENSMMQRLVIATAWWHVRRSRLILRQMYGKEVASKVTFVSLPAKVTWQNLAKEVGKTIFMYLPETVRWKIEKMVRSFGFNPSN